MGIFSDGFKELKKASEPLYRSPKSIQETIEVMAVAENGIFEVAKNRFSKRERPMPVLCIGYGFDRCREQGRIGKYHRNGGDHRKAKFCDN